MAEQKIKAVKHFPISTAIMHLPTNIVKAILYRHRYVGFMGTEMFNTVFPILKEWKFKR